MDQRAQDAPGSPASCRCDECARKLRMLQALEAAAVVLTAEGGAPPPLVEELREDLRRHTRRAALGRLAPGVLGDRQAILKASAQRPWLAYDPDALLPSPLDTFLLGGDCPRVPWVEAGGVLDFSDISVCYVVGCGRSGTTIFAELLSHHSSAIFLNEPRQLWIPVLPAMDVWSVAAPERRGQLVFTAQDAQGDQHIATSICEAYRDLRGLVQGSAIPAQPAEDRCVIIEKFPEHAFRLPFLAQLRQSRMPQGACSFIHMLRDGVEVARSIARFASSAAWYGVRDDWKWRVLLGLLEVEEATMSAGQRVRATFRKLTEASDLGARLFARGLVEWALSVRAARRGAEAAAGAGWLELRYEDLLVDPDAALAAAEHLLGLSPSPAARRCAREALRGRPGGPPSTVEAKVLAALHQSFIEALLCEGGRQLPLTA